MSAYRRDDTYGRTPDYLEREREARRAKSHGGWGSSNFNKPKRADGEYRERELDDEPEQEVRKPLSEQIAEEYGTGGNKFLNFLRSPKKKKIDGIINKIVFGVGITVFVVLYIYSKFAG